MILLVEIQCKGWEHNSVNSGLIRQIKLAFPSDSVKLYAEEEHIKGIESYLAQYGMSVDAQAIDFFDYHDRNYARSDDYADILLGVLKDNPQAKYVVLLSCNKGIILAMRRVCTQYPDVVFQLVLHGALEEICWKPEKISIYRHIFRILWSIRHGKRYPDNSDPISIKECLEKCTQENCGFIVFSPCYKEELEGKIAESVISRINFIHHPSFDKETKTDIRKDGKIEIGVYGQAVNDNAFKIISEYNNNYDNGSVLFKVLTDNEAGILDLNNVIRLSDSKHVSGDELAEYIRSFDYILVPYDKNQYRACVSGILFDGISYEVPLLMLDSPHLRYYSQYNIGIICDSECDLAREISHLASRAYRVDEFKGNEIELRNTTLQYNLGLLLELFK